MLIADPALGVDPVLDAAAARAEDSSAGMARLALVRRVGCGLLGLQLIALMIFSAVQFQRYSVTSDYAFYSHAWFQIAHGHFTWNFFGNHGELTFILLAPAYWLWPHGPMLLWEQDIGVVGAELVAFLWICEIAATRRRQPGYLRPLLASAGLVALLADPWIWWALAFDFHFETVATLFAILFARELQKGRRRAWIWGALTLLSGDVATTYVVAIGVGAVIGSRRRLWGLVAVVAGVIWLVLLHGVGAMRGSANLVPLNYLAVRQRAGAPAPKSSNLVQLAVGILHQPGRVISVIWSKRINAWANVGASGLLGILAPVALFVPLAVIAENSLFPGIAFNQPLFQSTPIYIFVPVGTVMLLAWVAKRYRRLAVGLAVAVMLETIGWGVVWLPRTPNQWIRVSQAAEAKLNQFNREVPANDEVVASQGIIGRFSFHPYQEIVGPGGSAHLSGGPVWFALTPSIGVETAPAAFEEALVAELSGPLHARSVVVGDGVYAYEYTPRAGQTRLRLPGLPTVLPSWLFHSVSGVVVTTGPPSRWRVVGRGRRGYLVHGDYWNDPTGPALATAELSGHGVVSVEVWDVTTNALLAEQRVTLAGSRVQARVPFDVPTPQPEEGLFHGDGPFAVTPVVGLPGDQLEVRIYDFSPRSRPVAWSVGISSTQ